MSSGQSKSSAVDGEAGPEPQIKTQVRLYVAGGSMSSRLTSAWTRALLDLNPSRDFWSIEVVDIIAQPAVAEAARVLATPMVEFTAVSPSGEVAEMRRFVGDFSTAGRARDAIEAAGFAAFLTGTDDVNTPTDQGERHA